MIVVSPCHLAIPASLTVRRCRRTVTAELKEDVFETTNKGGLFSFKGAYGRVGILL
jgi:hypothetical protein